MNPEDLTDDEVKKYSQDIEYYFRSTGQLIPVTPAQVIAFEEFIHTHPAPVPEKKLTANDVLKRGYVPHISKETQAARINEYDESLSAAARNMENLTDDIIKKLIQDQEKSKGEKK